MFLFIDKSLDGISPLIYPKIPPPFPFLSKRKRKRNHPTKVGREENLHQVLFLISFVYPCLLLLEEQEDQTKLFLLELIFK